ncbi:MAG: geranyl transferase [Alteromonadaceae bacterium]|nr:MAG: geranyl transferase [Alteromonadaceae bacterium]
MTDTFSSFLSDHQTQVETQLAEQLQHQNAHGTQLINAMRHSLLDGGKRLRPILAYATAVAVMGTSNAHTDAFACAVECMHTYSLIHDDLPAMDDDDLRRGKPTCHIAFDEATAILAGDALQCMALETIVNADKAPADMRILAIQTLTKASGSQGMVIGQSIDMQAVNTTLDLPSLENMHKYKTGALIEASVALGAISAQASDEELKCLTRYARAIGLAFQVQDDILDVVGDSETLGKASGADQALNKPTYVSLLGLQGAKDKTQVLYQSAIAALDEFLLLPHTTRPQNPDLTPDDSHLRSLAHYIIDRTY